VPAEVVLYSRPHCGLCEDAAAELQALSSDLGFTFSERDIDADPALLERYDAMIPVVIANDRLIAHAPFLVEALRDLLTAALPRS
jgi:hypothetical protein